MLQHLIQFVVLLKKKSVLYPKNFGIHGPKHIIITVFRLIGFRINEIKLYTDAQTLTQTLIIREKRKD